MKRGKKLLLIIFCFMLSITIVKADYSDGTESGGGSNNAGKGCSGTDSCRKGRSYRTVQRSGNSEACGVLLQTSCRLRGA